VSKKLARRTFLNKTARRSEQFVSISIADLFVGRHSAGRSGLDFSSVGQASDSVSGRTWRTYRPVDSADHTCWQRFACHHISLMVGNIRQLGIAVVRSGTFKRKPFNSNLEGHLVIIGPLPSVILAYRAIVMQYQQPIEQSQ
jgi:hypothetical protein